MEAINILFRNDNHTETLIFCSYHPSVFGKKKDFFYEGVMDHYRAFIQRYRRMN